MKKSYLITGGCGFFGSNLAARLLERGETVVLFDNLSRTGSSENLRWLRSLGQADLIQGDVADSCALEDTIKKVRPLAVFHLAGQVAMTTSVLDPFGDFRTNVLGTMNLLEKLRLYCPEAVLVYSSSNKVYGKLAGIHLVERATRYEAPGHPKGIDESTPIDFRTPYGCSKGAADQYVLEYARTYGLRTVVFRHSTIYGSRQYSTNDQGWVGWFCRQSLIQKENPGAPPFTIAGNGKQVRDLLYIQDALDCYLAAQLNIGKVAGRVFNLGGGMENSLSLLELLDFFEKKLDIKLRYERLSPRYDDQKFFVSNNQAVSKCLNWAPQTGKNKGLEALIAWTQSALKSPLP